MDEPPMLTVYRRSLRRGTVGLTKPGVAFLDPWHVELLSFLIRHQLGVTAQRAAVGRELGAELPNVDHLQVSGWVAMQGLLMRLQYQLGQPLGDREWHKLAWLHNRVALRMALPNRAADIPRIRP